MKPFNCFIETGADEYKWSDGSVLDYERWSPDEPSNSGGMENRGEMQSRNLHSWNDIRETDARNFACKSENG